MGPAPNIEDTAPHVVGELGRLIPAPVDAIHAGLSWTAESEPKICFGMRPAEYAGYHLVDPVTGQLDPKFEELVYGGYGFSTGAHGLDESSENGDISRDNFVCWHLNHPDAFNDTGVFAIVDDQGMPLVSKADFALTEDAYTDAGHSTGLNYNIFCAGNVALADGRWLFVGGHDKAGNHGIRKITIFDPVTETWADRGIPQVKADFLADPDGTEFEHASPLDEANTDPPHPSDMKYQRWYPTAVVMPNKEVLILSGTDQDSSLGPPPPSPSTCTSTTDRPACSKVRQATPEIYDPDADRTIALENARKLFNMYPRAYVVQTGPRWNDWKVAVIGEVDDAYLDPETKTPPLDILGRFDPWTYTGKTYFLDVQKAAADPDRAVPAEDHWGFIDEAEIAHDYGAGAQLWELDEHGHAVEQRVALFGGGCGRIPRVDGEPAIECPRDAVEMIDFQEGRHATWEPQEPLLQPTARNNAVVTPDGKVVIIGGALGRGPWDNSYRLQRFDPEDGSITPLVETEIARHDHSTATLLPDGRIAIMGGNSTDLAGSLDHLYDNIPVTQLYSPAYLYKGPRPVVERMHERINYHRRFVIKLSDDSPEVKSVAIIRMGPVTHNWDWDKRYVKLWFKTLGNGDLLVQAPATPAAALPGDYMLFVVSEDGVPSMAERLHLDYAGEGR